MTYYASGTNNRALRLLSARRLANGALQNNVQFAYRSTISLGRHREDTQQAPDRAFER